jgi:hypothetical protein
MTDDEIIVLLVIVTILTSFVGSVACSMACQWFNRPRPR